MSTMRSLLSPVCLTALALAALAVSFSGCSKKPDLPPVKEWAAYSDPYQHIAFTYPKGWVLKAEGSQVVVFTSADAEKKFLDPASTGADGAKVEVIKERLDSLVTAESSIDAYAKDLSGSGFKVEPDNIGSIAGLPAKAIKYSGAYSKEAKLHAVRVAVLKDSTMYTLTYAAFNDYYEPYKTALDSLLASLAFPTPATAGGADPSLPSPVFVPFDNFAVSIQIPENFDPSMPRPKGDVKFSMDIKGYRQDCTIHIDILPSKGQPVEKAVEQNLKFYKPTSRGETKLDGQKAIYLNYSPAKNISSRAYFVVKGDKMARVIVNIFMPMKDKFLPAFEKSIASLKIK
jgi:hypothetical protein